MTNDMEPCRWRVDNMCNAGGAATVCYRPESCDTRQYVEALEEVADTVQREVQGWSYDAFGLCVVPLAGVKRIAEALKQVGR